MCNVCNGIFLNQLLLDDGVFFLRLPPSAVASLTNPSFNCKDPRKQGSDRLYRGFSTVYWWPSIMRVVSHTQTEATERTILPVYPGDREELTAQLAVPSSPFEGDVGVSPAVKDWLNRSPTS